MAAGDYIFGDTTMLYFKAAEADEYKIVGCLETLSWEIAGEDTETTTKCGVATYPGVAKLTIEASGIAVDTASPDTRVSLDVLKKAKVNRLQGFFRVGEENKTDAAYVPGSLAYVEGKMSITSISADIPANDFGKFTISLASVSTFKVTDDTVVTP